ELARPPRRVLAGVGVDGLVGPAVHAPVGLAVPGEVDALRAHAPLDRRLHDGAVDDLAAPEAERRGAADVDGHDPRGLGHAIMVAWPTCTSSTSASSSTAPRWRSSTDTPTPAPPTRSPTR